MIRVYWVLTMSTTALSSSPTSLKRAAFTLTEFLVVLGIIFMLAGTSFVMFSGAMDFTERLQARASGARMKVEASAARGSKQFMSRRYSDAPTDRHIVVFNPTVANPQAEANRLAATYNIQVANVYTNAIKGMVIRTDSFGLWKVRTDPAVAYVEQEFRIYPAAQTIPPGIKRVGAPFNRGEFILSKKGPINLAPLPGSGTPPAKFAVAVVDTGVDKTHQDLNVVFAQNFTSDPAPGDGVGHGTHVAGTVAARNNTDGVAGVTPGVPIWDMKVFDSNGGGTIAEAMAALDFLIKNTDKVKVVNMSLGSAFSQAFNDSVTSAVKAGLVVVVSAGNEGQAADNKSPASCPDAITVAAFCDSDGIAGGLGPPANGVSDDTMAGFSNFGKFVDIIAPGVNVLSTLPGNNYGPKDGTSMSAPHVAGAASLVVEQGFFTFNPKTSIPPPVPGGTLAENVLKQLESMSSETIPGLGADTLKYRVLNVKGYD